MVAGTIGGLLLGPIGGLLAGTGAGWFGGNLIDQEIQRDAEQLQLAFQGMLGEYDNTVNRMADLVRQMLGNYYQAVESAIAAAQGKAPKRLPF
jgi:hypothetical protein